MRQPEFENLLEYIDATTITDIEPTADGIGVLYHASPFPDLHDLLGDSETGSRASGLVGVHFSQVPPYALIHATEKVHFSRAMPHLYGRPVDCRIYRAEITSSNPLIVDRPKGFNPAGFVGREEEKRIHDQAIADGYDSIRLMRGDGVVFELVALPGCKIVYLSEMGHPCTQAKIAAIRTRMPLYCEREMWPLLLPNALRSFGITRLVDPSTGDHEDVPPGPFDRSILPSWAKPSFD